MDTAHTDYSSHPLLKVPSPSSINYESRCIFCHLCKSSVIHKCCLRQLTLNLCMNFGNLNLLYFLCWNIFVKPPLLLHPSLAQHICRQPAAPLCSIHLHSVSLCVPSFSLPVKSDIARFCQPCLSVSHEAVRNHWLYKVSLTLG